MISLKKIKPMTGTVRKGVKTNKYFNMNHFPRRLNLTVHVNFRDEEQTLLHEIDLYCKLCGLSRQAFLKGCAVEFLRKEVK